MYLHYFLTLFLINLANFLTADNSRDFKLNFLNFLTKLYCAVDYFYMSNKGLGCGSLCFKVKIYNSWMYDPKKLLTFFPFFIFFLFNNLFLIFLFSSHCSLKIL